MRCQGLARKVMLEGKAKKIGAGIGDPNLRFQPRLPGSVVGEASMEQLGKADKITEVTARG